MAKYYGAEEKLPEIREWYDGYDFAGTEIYNPWSVLKYFKGNCKPDAYWLDTSSNDLITEIVRDLPHDTVKTLEALLRDETPRVPMAKDLGPYKSIRERKDSLYALLVSAGYLKVASPLVEGRCRVAIPNHEIAQVFVSFPAFIIEVKKADAATDDLKALAREAREQIDGKQYDTTFRAAGIVDVEKIGLAYFKNAVEICK